MKKIICIVLLFSMLLTCFASAAYEPPTTEMVDKWGYIPGGDPVLIESYEAEHYAISAYYDGSVVYCITIMDTGDVDFAWSDNDGVSGNVMTTLDELNIKSRSDNLTLISSEKFIAAVKNFGMKFAERNVEPSKVLSSARIDTITNSTRQTDLEILTGQLWNVHGNEYSGRNWTSLAYEHYNGLMFSYKEDLYYGLEERSIAEYVRGATLGEVAAIVMGATPAAVAVLSGLSFALGIAEEINTVLLENGVVSHYYGDAIYSRYVLIENSGPYYQCSHVMYYNGWINYGESGTDRLVTFDTERYFPSEDVFESKSQQRLSAYWNY